MQPFNIFDKATNMSIAPSYPMSTAPSFPMSTAPTSFPMSRAPIEMPKPFDYGFGKIPEQITPEIARWLKPVLAWYSDKDMEFLRQVKANGYTPEQAFKALQDVKKQIETKATEQKAMETEQLSKAESAKRSVSPIGDIVWWAVSQVPRILANTIGLAWELGGYINPMDNPEATKAISRQIQWIGETGGQFVEKYGAYDPMSTATAIGKEWANIGSVLATPGWVLGAGLKSAPLLGKVALWATAGAIDAAKYSAVSRAELPTGSELAIGASLGGLVPAVWGLYGSLKWTKAFTPKVSELSQAAAKVWTEMENLWKYGLQTQRGIIDWQEAIITKPSKTIWDVVKTPFATKDTNKLIGRALTPSYAGKTGKQIVYNIANTEKRATELHKLVRTWKLDGSLDSLQDAAETVVNWLDTVGERIGGAIGKLEWKSRISLPTRSEIRWVLKSAIEQDAGAFQALKKFADRTKWELSYSDLFKVKKIYSKEISKLTRNGDGGTDSYSALVKWVQEITDILDTAVEKKLVGSKFADDKRIYRTLKELASDIAKSAQVDARRSPQTLTEQLGFIQALTSPGEFAKRAFAREIGEMNTRGGTWKQFIDILDERAVKNARNVPKPKVTPPKKPNVLSPKWKTQPSGQSKNPIKGVAVPKPATPAPVVPKPAVWKTPIIWLTEKGGVKNVLPWNQVKYNQWNWYEPVRMVLTDRDADIARWWALQNKGMKTPSSSIYSEMKSIENRLKKDWMERTDIQNRVQEIKDIAKNARSKTESVLVDLRKTTPSGQAKNPIKGKSIKNFTLWKK